MKINYLRIKNFKAISAALNKKSLEIDFTKMNTKILLLLGDNGTCKTFLLSLMHPFAHLGNVDVRNDDDIILDDVDGEKEIHIENKGDIYVIKHYYQHQKKGRKISSYISKNNMELNETGLVTKFNQIIETEFGIDQGFLRVIRLGSNVNNLIKLRSTERKDFISKMLSDVEIYRRDYKEASELVKYSKNLIKNVTDKIKRLSISDPLIFLEQINVLEDKLKLAEDEKEKLIIKYGEFKGRINSLLSEGVENISENINTARKNIKEKENLVYDKKREIEKLDECIYKSNLEKELSIANEKYEKLNISHHILLTNINSATTRIIEYENSIMDTNSKIKISDRTSNIEDVCRRIEYLKEYIAEREKIINSYVPSCTKEDILEDQALLLSIETIVKTSWEFSNASIDLFAKFSNKSGNIKDRCISKLIKLNNELGVCDQYDSMKTDIIVTAPFECKLYKKCYAFNQLNNSSKSRSRKVIEEEIEDVNGCMRIVDNYNKLKTVMLMRNKKLPYTVTLDDIMTDILNKEITFWDRQEVTNHIKLIEIYDEITNAKQEYVNLSSELNSLNSEKENVYDNLVSTLEDLNREKDILNASLDEMRDDSNKLNKEKTRAFNKVEAIKLSLDIDNLYSDIDKDNEYLSTQNENIKNLESLEKGEVEYSFNLSKINRIIGELRIELNKRKAYITEYNTLTEEKEKLDKDFKENILIQSAVSSTKGIPLIHINKYLRQTQIDANKIIQSVYGDDIMLDSFVISENEFRIPYIKNGMYVSDISAASQGESSIISLAISVSLIKQLCSEYNILLLDEVDGALDNTSKPKFIRIIEEFDCEQIIVITHNPLYETYPVDAYITKANDTITNSFKNVNIIN